MAGVLIGEFRYQMVERPVRLPDEALSSHILILGKTQRGKSALLSTLMQAIMERGDRTLILFDPHGDLAVQLRRHVPHHRIRDVVNLDLSELSHPIGFNLLEPRVHAQRSVDKIVSDFVDLGRHLWPENWGPRMEDVLRFSLKLLIIAGRQGPIPYTIVEANRLLTDRLFRRLVLDSVPDPELKRYWDYEYERLSDSFRDEIIKPVLTKMNRLSDSDAARLIFGQTQTRLDLEDILDHKSIFIVNTAKGLVGADIAALLGSLLLNHLKTTVAERQARAPGERQPVTIVIDELQTFVSTTFEGILSEIAKYGVNLVLATQTLDLLDTFDPSLRPIVISNQSTLFCFETSADDAAYLVPELDEVITAQDLINLPRYTCYCKTFKAGRRLPVFSLTTLPPASGDELVAQQVVLASQQRWGRPRAEVERELRIRAQRIDEAVQNAIRKPSHLEMQRPRASGAGSYPQKMPPDEEEVIGDGLV